ncbi:Tumor necrosis factor receptor superfamily member 26 TNF receptor -like protein 3 Precursor [Channa argus]|uniref:Tumor necrosis factor receptor superfamily member 26 TNF receptor-like protein 3 n=1 Tax=Channa argus TaxID=215402 RepID=A0A6G1QH64_CHAAH|nr:Tumor necrosis factor receptor superfamily member 26 TNF receptor -like protein 3 Precursor [Channa argus]
MTQVVAPLLIGLVCHAAEPSGSQWSSDEHRNLTLSQHRTCVENEQYSHQGVCCLNCQAGTYVHKTCERDQEPGICLPCEHGQTYTEHSNGMNRCLPCTHCRSDEITTASCTPTTDTRCQCKQGTFCVPDQACEVCKRCAKCKPGEEEVKKCTPFSNTVCQKQDPSPTENSPAPPIPSPSPPADITIPLCVFLAILLILILLAAYWFVKKQQSLEMPCLKSHCDSSEIVKIPIGESETTAEERQNNQNAGLEGEESRPESRPLLQETQPEITKASPPLEDEDRGLGDSLPNTTSSSQTSLSALPTAASSGNTPHQSPTAFRPPPADMDDPLLHRLLPLLGSEKSLKKSFDLFDEFLDVRIHNKFFRMIGVSDNHIRIAENGAPGDKVYELLKNWMQRQGLKADINDLLEALLGLDQRRSAECIAFAALQKGFYKHADTP